MIQLIVLYAVFTAVTSIITVDDGWDARNYILLKNGGRCHSPVGLNCSLLLDDAVHQNYDEFYYGDLFAFRAYQPVLIGLPDVIILKSIVLVTTIQKREFEAETICTTAEVQYGYEGNVTRKRVPLTLSEYDILSMDEVFFDGESYAQHISVECIEQGQTQQEITILEEVKAYAKTNCMLPLYLHGIKWLLNIELHQFIWFRVFGTSDEENFKESLHSDQDTRGYTKYECLTSLTWPPYGRKIYYVRRNMDDHSITECVKLYHNVQSTLLVEHSVRLGSIAGGVPISDCLDANYSNPARILMKYPIHLARTECPFPSLRYQVTYTFTAAGQQLPKTYCANDNSSYATMINTGEIHLQSCMKNQSTYYHPFNSSLICSGLLDPSAFGSNENKTGFLVSFFSSENGEELGYYGTSFKVHLNGTVHLTLQGNVHGYIEPSADNARNSDGYFSIALILSPTCELRPDRCENNGTCLSHECTCMPGYTGVLCEKDVDDCLQTNCNLHGNCIDHFIGFYCDCDEVSSGLECEIVEYCQSDPCMFGVCKEIEGGFACDCPSGHTGFLCEQELLCASCPCQFGSCQEDVANFMCECAAGTTGDFCDQVLFSVTIEGYDGTLQKGEDLSLSCRMNMPVDGTDFTWLFTDDYTGRSQVIAQNREYVKLTVTESDAGEYECQASNSDYAARASVTIQVLSSSEPGTSPQAQRETQNANSSLVIGLSALIVILLIAIVALIVLLMKFKRKLSNEVVPALGSCGTFSDVG